ncbi:MAG: SUMF1/EgtB/PvdO family nonheme iron enzyme [Elusimicrobiota bacterium]
MKKIIIILVIVYLTFEIVTDMYFLKKEIPKITKKEIVTPSAKPEKLPEYKKEKESVSNITIEELLKKEKGAISDETKLSVYERKEKKDITEDIQTAEEYKKTDELIASSKVAEPLERISVTSEDIGDMVLVDDGEFIFGSNTGLENERPARRFYLEKFYIDKYEVTNKKYKEFVDTTGHTPPLDWSGNEPPIGKLDHPVTNVSYNDAVAYTKWCGKRLPTEQEWEKVAKGPGVRLYPWGDMFDDSKANVIKRFFRRGTTSVGSFEDGKSFYGCYDLSGNVWEWTSSDYQGNMKKISIIAIQFSMIISVLIVGIMCVTGYLIIKNQKKEITNDMLSKGKYFTNSISSYAKQAFFPEPDIFFLKYLTEEMLKDESIIYVNIYKNDSRLMASEKNIRNSKKYSKNYSGCTCSRYFVNIYSCKYTCPSYK